MTDQKERRSISDIVVPGIDFAEKVKIDHVIGKQVDIVEIEKVTGSPEFSVVDEETGEVITRDYWNVECLLDGKRYTFSTGAMPIDKVLSSLQTKLDNGEADLPLFATFRKEGRTYTIS
jgi:hypothetical protein